MASGYSPGSTWVRWRDLALPAAIFVALFGATTYALSPRPVEVSAEVSQMETAAPKSGKRFTDQHYAGCNAARANDHENIAAWEPSYRLKMDGDGDGVACEPYRGNVASDDGWLGN
ncbi:excalibur calcium-binding domain-containing protein [Brevundimonas alba]|uniref:excalibur calcium-binding domain-containing protein n=1 Tax=Brevundimonas alba TaxID=74314 RepID=UPI00143A410D|nr:excalibur calcium-binding domain-containing protein [Brevundimonas alba]